MKTLAQGLRSIEGFAFIGHAQRRAMIAGMRGEERAWFLEKLQDMLALVETMPQTYGQDGVSDPIAYLHYFTASADWYITEKDVDHDGAGQVQAFGLADLFRDGGEMGYISITELVECGAELDLHFTPRPLSIVHSLVPK